MMAKLKSKWGITSNGQVILIMVVFSLAGMAITQCRQPVFHVLGLTEQTPMWIKVVAYLLSIFPLYQLFLLIFGALLGQFRFFWEKEKKMARWMVARFAGSKNDALPVDG